MIKSVVPSLVQTGAGPHAFTKSQAQVGAPKGSRLREDSGTDSPHDNF